MDAPADPPAAGGAPPDEGAAELPSAPEEAPAPPRAPVQPPDHRQLAAPADPAAAGSAAPAAAPDGGAPALASAPEEAPTPDGEPARVKPPDHHIFVVRAPAATPPDHHTHVERSSGVAERPAIPTRARSRTHVRRVADDLRPSAAGAELEATPEQEQEPDNPTPDESKATTVTPPDHHFFVRRGSSSASLSGGGKLERMFGASAPPVSTFERDFGADSRLRGATLESLVDLLTHDTSTELMDVSNVTALLLTYRSFTSAAELVDVLAQRLQRVRAGTGRVRALKLLDAWVREEGPQLDADVRARMADVVRLEVAVDDALLAVAQYPWAARDESELSFALGERVFVTTRWDDDGWWEGSTVVTDDGDDDDPPEGATTTKTGLFPHNYVTLVEAPADANARVLLARKVLRDLESPPAPAHVVVPPAPPAVVRPGPLALETLSKREFARQLTLIMARNFGAVRPPIRGTPEARDVVRFATRLSQWVARCILGQPRLDARRAMLMRFVKIAQYLRGLGNFDGLFAVVSGLQSAPVHRLKHTFQGVRGVQELAALTVSDGSWRAYREALLRTQPPAVPYLGVVLTDLTFIDENSDVLPESGLINFAKARMAARVIEDDVRRFQRAPFALEPLPDMQAWILDHIQCTPLGDTEDVKRELFEESLRLEERGGPAPRGSAGGLLGRMLSFKE